MSASAIRATGNSVSTARAHMGQVTGKRTPGSFHPASFPSLFFNAGGLGGNLERERSEGSSACARPMPGEFIVKHCLQDPRHAFESSAPPPCVSFSSIAHTASIVGHGRQPAQCGIQGRPYTVPSRKQPRKRYVRRQIRNEHCHRKRSYHQFVRSPFTHDLDAALGRIVCDHEHPCLRSGVP